MVVGCVAAALALPAPASASPDGDAVLAATTLTVANNNNVAVTPMCSSGARALGGGVQPLTPATGGSYNAYRIGFSAPVDETGTTAATNGGDIPRGWTVEFTNFGGPQQFRVYAICSVGSNAVLSEFTLATAESVGAATNERTVACPAGSRAIGGGVGTTTAIPASNAVAQPYSYRNTPVGAALDPSAVATGDVPRGWTANASVQGGATPIVFRFYAVCSASSDATIVVAPFSVTDLGGDAVNGATASCGTGRRALSGGVTSNAIEGPGISLRTQRNGPLDAASTADSPSGTDTGDAVGSWYAASRYLGGTSTSASFKTVAVCASDVAATPPADTTAPNTVAGKGPKKKSTKKKAKFSFSSSEPGTSFECALDKQQPKPCTSPAKVKKLKPGKHRFTVTAIDVAGNRDPSPVVFKFKVTKKKK